MIQKHSRFLSFLLCCATLFTVLTVYGGWIQLSWSPPTNNTDGSVITNLAGYKVLYGPNFYTYPMTQTIGNVTSTVISNLTDGITYHFVCRAYNTDFAESENSQKLIWSVPLANEAFIDNEYIPSQIFGIYEVIGTWQNDASVGSYYTNCLNDMNTDKGSKSVIFRPLLKAGQYEVFTWYVANSNRATNVPYDIISRTGTYTVAVNQRLNPSIWYKLGTYTFNNGTNGYVKIRTTGTSGYVIADAMRFYPVSLDPSSSTSQINKPTSVKTGIIDLR